MKKLTLILSAALALAGAARADDLTDAEVRKVDKDAGRITLKHGEIRSLDMPPMTMVFGVKDKAMLERVKPGDKVKCQVVKQGGDYVVTELQPAR